MKPKKSNPFRSSVARLSLPFASALIALFTAHSATAAVRYWDPLSSGGFGSVNGTDTWATSTNLIWTASNDGSTTRLADYVTTTSDDLHFGGPTASLGAGTVPVGTVSAGTINFNTLSGNMLLSGGIITMKAAATITTVNSAQAHTISSEIKGAATSLTKAGAGTLVLSGVNTYSGSTIISGGTLVLNNASALGGTSGISMSAGTTLRADLGITTAAPITLSGTGNITIANGTNTAVTANYNGGIIGNTTTLTFSTLNNTGNPAHVISLGAASSYTGNTTITVGSTVNNLTVRSGATNSLSPTTVLTFAQVNGSTSGRSTIFDLNGNNQTLAGLSNGGTVPQVRNMTVTSAAAATLTINSTANHIFGGRTISTTVATVGVNTRAQISGAISLVKNGTGTFTLGGTLAGGATEAGNAFTGSTQILGGILVLGETLSIQNSAFDTAGSIAGDAASGLRAGIDGIGVTTLTLGGLTGNKNFADVFTSTTGGYANLANLTFNPGTGVSNSYSGDVGNGNGSMTLTKAGLGTQTIAVAQTYSGGTIVSAGTLALSGTGTLGASGTALTTSGGSLDLGSLSQTVGAVSVTGAATISNGNLTGTSYAASNTTGTAIISANLLANGAAGFDKTGAGTATLSGTNTYTGATTITAGVLGTALPDNLAGYTNAGKVVFNGGRLNIVTGDGTTTGWTATQAATLLSNATKTSGTLGVTVSNGDVTETTALDFGGLNLVKSGTDTLTLNQAHTLGATTITNGGGTLKITDAAALGAGAVTIQTASTNSGTLELALTGSNTITNTFNGFNSANALGSGVAQIRNTSGTNEIISDLRITSTGGNGLNVESNGGLLTLSGTITHTITTSNRTLSLGGSGNGVVSGAINDNTTNSQFLIVNKSGAGTWTLTNASSNYSGNTNVNGGTLIVNGNISTSVLTNVASGATIGGSGRVGALTIQSGGFIAPGNSSGILNTGNYTQAGTYNAEINGLTAGTLHDQIIVTGSADISGGSLAALFSGTYAVNDMVFLLRNDGTDGVVGTYTGLDQGAVAATYGGFDWQISYVADFDTTSFTNGNDIALMAVAIPEPSAALLGALGAMLLLRRRR